MAGDGKSSGSRKISQEFAARLGRLGPEQRIRAIVVVNVKPQGRVRKERLSGPEKKAALDAIRGSARESLAEIDDILRRHGGTRLAATIDALGCVVVEATSRSIEALSASAQVKTILEDQSISPLPKPKR